MTEDRLQVLDVDVCIDGPARIGAAFQAGDNQTIAVCDRTRVIVIANGRFIDLYGACANSSHPFAFLQQISIGEYVNRSPKSQKISGDALDVSIVVTTCVVFPVPGFLLVGAFVEALESDISGNGEAVESRREILLLGFRLYAGSASRFTGDMGGENVRQGSASVQVHFSFVEPVVGISAGAIRRLQPFRRDMTPDTGSVVVLIDGCKLFGVLCWKERFSDRQMCLARLKQQSEALVAAECSPDGRYLVIGDAEGRLSLLDFRDFLLDDHEISSRVQPKLGGKRLKIEGCTRSGVITRDSPLENVRLVHTITSSGTNCAYTSMRWWITGVGDQQKQFVLAGKQDGSLSVLKLVQESDKVSSIIELKMVQLYPGLASGTHDVVRSISEPTKITAPNTADDTWLEFYTISEMRWRTWRIKIAGASEGLTKRYRMIWPSVKDSLDFPAFMIRAKTIKGIAMLFSPTELSKLVAAVLSDAIPDHAPRYPISLMVADNRLQVAGLLTTTPVEVSSESESSPSEPNECEIGDGKSEREVAAEDLADTKTERIEDKQSSGPATIQDKYKLPPMEWKSKGSTPGSASQNGERDEAGNNRRVSKLSRVDYDKRVASVKQRVETLGGVMKSMRTSFQLFSSDVQQHMNLVSEQLEEISRRRGEIMEKSFLQAQAEMARFDAGTRPHEGEDGSNNQRPSPAIPYVADKYNPDHPDADWGGYVRRSYKKRFYTNQSSVKDNLTYDEKGGIMPRGSAENSMTSGKKLFEPQQGASGEQVPGIPFQSAVYQVGPGSDVSCSDWKTSYASQTAMDATSKDNYVLGTRQNAQHKRHVTPMYEQGRGVRQNSARAQSPSWEGGPGLSTPLSGSGSSGSLSGRRVDSRRSLLAGIGKLVAAEDLNGALPPPERHLPESYTKQAPKALLAENYHGTTLGYTGRRNMPNY
ncbi:hypothetical protein PRIC1_015088 [Phytophthora ramorum]